MLGHSVRLCAETHFFFGKISAPTNRTWFGHHSFALRFSIFLYRCEIRVLIFRIFWELVFHQSIGNESPCMYIALLWTNFLDFFFDHRVHLHPCHGTSKPISYRPKANAHSADSHRSTAYHIGLTDTRKWNRRRLVMRLPYSDEIRLKKRHSTPSIHWLHQIIWFCTRLANAMEINCQSRFWSYRVHKAPPCETTHVQAQILLLFSFSVPSSW